MATAIMLISLQCWTRLWSTWCFNPILMVVKSPKRILVCCVARTWILVQLRAPKPKKESTWTGISSINGAYYLARQMTHVHQPITENPIAASRKWRQLLTTRRPSFLSHNGRQTRRNHTRRIQQLEFVWTYILMVVFSLLHGKLILAMWSVFPNKL